MKKGLIIFACIIFLAGFILAAPSAPSPSCKVDAYILNVTSQASHSCIITSGRNIPAVSLLKVRILNFSEIKSGDCYGINSTNSTFICEKTCADLYPLNSELTLTIYKSGINGINKTYPLTIGKVLRGNIHFTGDECASGIYLNNYTSFNPVCKEYSLPYNGWCKNGTIVSGVKDAYNCTQPSTCIYNKTLSSTTPCPRYASPPLNWCKNGTVIQGGRDAKNCAKPVVCVYNRTYEKTNTNCSRYSPIPSTWCANGTITIGGKDLNNCTKPSTCFYNKTLTSAIDCPRYSAPPLKWCANGTVISGGYDKNSCAKPPVCVYNKTLCPVYASFNSTICTNGTLIPAGLDSYNCQKPSICVPYEINSTTGCTIWNNTPGWCENGTVIQGGYDSNNCSRKPICDYTVCPVYAPLPDGWCENGTVISGTLDENNCTRHPICAYDKLNFYNKSESCMDGCVCSNISIKCSFNNGTKIMTIYTKESGNVIIEIENINLSTNVTLYKLDGKVYGVFRGNITHEVILPDEIKDKIENTTTITLENQSINLDEDGNYDINATKDAMLFLIFPVKEKVQLEINSQTGQITKTKTIWWGFLAMDIPQKINQNENPPTNSSNQNDSINNSVNNS